MCTGSGVEHSSCQLVLNLFCSMPSSGQGQAPGSLTKVAMTMFVVNFIHTSLQLLLQGSLQEQVLILAVSNVVHPRFVNHNVVFWTRAQVPLMMH